MDLSQQHPAYVKTQADRIASRHLYEGTRAVRDQGETYLYKHPNETTSNYELRLKRAIVEPFVEKIVVSRDALLFGKPHMRDLPGPLKEYVSDVDRRGTPASVFFQKAAFEAQIDGIHWVCVDMTRLPEEGEYPSRAAEVAAGHRPFFEHIPGSAVIDWEIGEDKKLNWIVIEQQKQLPRPTPGETREVRKRYKVWTRQTWTIYEVVSEDKSENSKKKDKGPTIVDAGANTLGQVPLIPFYGFKDEDEEFCGWPVAKTILEHVILRFNKSSDLDWSELLASHPIPYVISPKPPKKLDVNQGLHIESAPNSGQIEIGYLEPSNAGIDGLRESIKGIDSKIYAIALAQALKDTSQVESSEGQRESRKIFTTSLKSVSVSYEESERECWKLMLAWQRPANAAGEPKVDYARDFDDRMIEEGMIGALQDLADGNYITGRTLLLMLREGEILPESVDIEEELQALKAARVKAAVETLRELNPRSSEGSQAA